MRFAANIYACLLVFYPHSNVQGPIQGGGVGGGRSGFPLLRFRKLLWKVVHFASN